MEEKLRADDVLNAHLIKYADSALFAAWMIALFTLSSIPGETATDLADSLASDFKLSDVVYHIGAFAVLGILAYRFAASILRAATVQIVLLALACSIGYGVLDEFHQSFVPGRTATIIDVGYDAIGSVVGVVAAALKWPTRHRSA